MTISVTAASLALGTVLAIASPVARAAVIDPAEARAIAAEAYVYAYAPLYNYKTWFQRKRSFCTVPIGA